MRGLMERSFKNVASIALPERNKDYVMHIRGSPGEMCSVISVTV